jgi:hypothetical protein
VGERVLFLETHDHKLIDFLTSHPLPGDHDYLMLTDGMLLMKPWPIVPDGITCITPSA